MNRRCPWCDGEDRNFRPLRFGIVPCANSWHNTDALQANMPCLVHNHKLPCPYCRIAELEKILEDKKNE